MAAKKWISFGRPLCTYGCALSCIFIPAFHISLQVWHFVCCILCSVHTSTLMDRFIFIFFLNFDRVLKMFCLRPFSALSALWLYTERDNSSLKKMFNVEQKTRSICDDRYRLLGFERKNTASIMNAMCVRQGYVKQQIGPIYSYIDKHNSIRFDWAELDWIGWDRFQVCHIFSTYVDASDAYVWPPWLLSKKASASLVSNSFIHFLSNGYK